VATLEFLARAGFHTCIARDGAVVPARVADSPDLVLPDIMLPGQSGRPHAHPQNPALAG
jgi:DNA-binding response OmpR family regulator